MEDCAESIEVSQISGYRLLFKALSVIPITHYVIALYCVFLVFLYNFLELHFFEDLLSGGSAVNLTYHSGSELYQSVVSKCKILHTRYLSTPWLASPHFHTTLIELFGRPPAFTYKRELFHASDGGTIALDWLMSSSVLGSPSDESNVIPKNTTTPIVVVVPGLTSDSSAAYVKLFAFKMAKYGWDVLVTNHRGMGGVSFTSDRIYNAGWTMDIRDINNHLREEYPDAPLYLVGLSIGANIVGKYLGEDGDQVPVAGAAVICSPWDLLIGSRFIKRRLVQRFYDRVLAIGLQGYAMLNEAHFTKHGDWEGILKARTIRDFDKYATCVATKIETVDTYYRWASSAGYVKGVSVPLLCISSLDDPVCPGEAIPWDECRANKNVVLATTKHGGHLGYFEGITASGLWWVGAVNEYFDVLHASPLKHKQKKSQSPGHCTPEESLIDQSPYVTVTNGMVAPAAVDEDLTEADITQNGSN
ncbi:hypothetical protein AgCh_008633 [Apium graveolens]